MRDEVYSVHATRPDDTGAVEIVFRTEREAVAYARDRSDWAMLLLWLRARFESRRHRRRPPGS